MIRFIRKLLGLCEHGYSVVKIIWWHEGPVAEVLQCERCGDVKVRKT